MKSWQYKIGISLKELSLAANREVDASEFEDWLAKNDFDFEKVKVLEALKRTIPSTLGAYYKSVSNMRLDAPQYFSCSSLVSYLYTEAGVWMPSISIDKYAFGKPIAKSEIKFGDLIFLNSGRGMIRTETVEFMPGTPIPEGVDHVGMYLDSNKVIHATKKAGRVLIEDFEDFARETKVVGYRRMADINEERYVVFIPETRPDLKKTEDLAGEFVKN